MLDTMRTNLLRGLARSRIATDAAVRIRNQLDCILHYHLASSFNRTRNGEWWLLDSLPALDVFVDAGANVGDWTAAVLERFPAAHGIAIEPGSVPANRLRSRFNGRVRVIEAALDERKGTLAFHERADSSEFSSTHLAVGTPQTRPAIMVPAVTIDSLGLERIDVLKIDVEGSEAAAIRGASEMLSAQRIGMLQFEYNSTWLLAGESLRNVIKLLDGWKYETYLLRPRHLEPVNPRWGEPFAFANFVARPRRTPRTDRARRWRSLRSCGRSHDR